MRPYWLQNNNLVCYRGTETASSPSERATQYQVRDFGAWNFETPRRCDFPVSTEFFSLGLQCQLPFPSQFICHQKMNAKHFYLKICPHPLICISVYHTDKCCFGSNVALINVMFPNGLPSTFEIEFTKEEIGLAPFSCWNDVISATFRFV